MVYSPQPQSKKYTKLYVYSLRYLPFKILEKVGIKNLNKNKFIHFLTSLGFSLITGTIGFLIIFLLTPSFADITIYYLLFTLIAALNSWFGDLIFAIFTSVVAMLGALYFFGFQPQIVFFFQTSVFILVSLFTAVLIQKAKRTDEFKKYKIREEQYAQSYTHLYEKLSKAEKEIKSRDEFLSLASHELKTPLTSMFVQLQRMLNSIRNVSLAKFSIPQLMKVLENAEGQVKKLSKMINDLLNVSLITTGRLDLELEKVNLNNVVKGVIKDFSDMLKQERYKVNFVAKSAVIGRWDKVRIEEVVTNLLSNAIKYGEGKPIEISVTNNRSLARLSINDSGIGIPYEKQKMLFEKFRRAVSSADGKKGLGVGLYIVNQIIKAHSGKIKLVSRPHKGSTFTVELPLNKES